MEIIQLNNKNRTRVLKKTVKYIKDGKIVVFPTDTVYGIICDATNKKATNLIFKIKKRPYKKFFPVFVKDIKMAKKIAEIDEIQERFLKKFWPGKITVILKRKSQKKVGISTKTSKLLKIYGVNKKTIALRVPNYKSLNLLLKKINTPLVQTSANISGKKTPKSAKEIMKIFKNKKFQPHFVIDAGRLKNAKQSKLIDLTLSPPKILRP